MKFTQLRTRNRVVLVCLCAGTLAVAARRRPRASDCPQRCQAVSGLAATASGNEGTARPAVAASLPASPRSGDLHVTKDCSEDTGLPGAFCTITSSNLAAIEVGSNHLPPGVRSDVAGQRHHDRAARAWQQQRVRPLHRRICPVSGHARSRAEQDGSRSSAPLWPSRPWAASITRGTAPTASVRADTGQVAVMRTHAPVVTRPHWSSPWHRSRPLRRPRPQR